MPKKPHGRRERGTSATSNPLDYAIASRTSQIVECVEAAVTRRDVLLAFQPVMHAASASRPAFYEGLIRLMDETGRIIPAREFINEVESTPLGQRIDTLALDLGLAALAEAPDLRLAINMSARSINNTEWMRVLERGLRLDPTAAERLILEITESSAIVFPARVGAFMDALHERGISFALDDFGAGYTSFRHLRELRFDIIKIDGQFINGIARDATNRVLTTALAMIARHFDMLTVAEGVEQPEDAACLMTLGIDCMQGYYFGAPTISPPWREETHGRAANRA